MIRPSKYSKVGLLAGVFDPIHWGHLFMAYLAMETVQLDAVWFIPTHTPPHKAPPKASYEDRKNMVKLAIADEPRFYLVELEKNPVPSYSYETAIKVRNTIDSKPYFIVGGDEWEQLHNWRRYDLLVENVIFVVVPRAPVATQRPEVQALFTEITPINISSTYIRQRVVEEKSIRALVPEAVELFIKEKGLYKQENDIKENNGINQKGGE
jgi:nicotinate-nucleotide adenylyltransferase